MKTKKISAETIYLLLLLAFAGLMFQQSSITKSTIEEPLTARVYGMIISALFIVAVATRLVKLIFSKNCKGENPQIDHLGLILFAAVLMLLYTIGILKIGYYVVTVIYLSIMMIALQDKEARTKKNCLLSFVGSLAFAVVLYIVFDAFNVFLPNAWLI